MLEPGRRVEHTLGAGERLSYAIVLEEGQLLPLVVRQQGVDVALTILAPGGERREINVAADVAWGDEPATLGPSAGKYVLEVQARGSPAASGRVALEAGELRPAGRPGKERLQAEEALAEGAAAMRAARSADAIAAAHEKLARAAASWREVGDAYWASIADVLAGSVSAGSDPAGSLERALEAARTFRALGRRGELARALQLVSVAHYNRGEYEAALGPDLEALSLYRDLGDSLAEAQVLDSLGGTYLDLGETRRSLDVREEALEIVRRARNREREAEVLANLGASYWFMGEIEKAYDLFVLAGRALREERNRLGEAATLHNMALCQLILGDPAKAEAGMREALPLCRDAGHRPCEAFVLQGLGLALDFLGRSSEALDLYAESLAIRRSLEDKDGEAWVLVTAAITRHRRGESQKAAELARQALGIYREIGGGWKLGLLLDLLGQIESGSGNREAGMAHHREALQVRRAVEDRQGQAVSTLRLARLERDGGDLVVAHERVEQAIRLMEDLRGRMLSPERRMAFMIGSSLWPSLRDAYEDDVEVLMALEGRQPGRGFAAMAFEISERARARVLVEMLSQVRSDLGAPGDAGLDRLRGLEDRLGAKLDQQVRVLSGEPREELRRSLAAEIEGLTGELEQARAQVRSASPRDAALRLPDPLGLPELQGELLDPDTLLLEYFLGDQRSRLWAVTATSYATYELPPRRQLEAAARNAYAAGSSRPRAGTSPERALREASRLLLGPVASTLGGRRVVIVPDGALHYVPFAALPDPEDPSLPLIARHEIVSLPSASALRLLRADARDRVPAPRTLVVLADPVFDRHDERLARATAHAARPRSADPALSHALHDVGVGGLPRLPFTRREARRILTLAPGTSRRAALDFDASLATATDPELAGYRYVHFATHGFLNGVRPELSGLVLSLVDRQGRDIRGFLSARDVFDLHLGAELVVLSGCSTGLGREMKGEGIVGLTRAFMHAGAQRVVASLWEVDDAATEELMGRLYEGMLGPRKLRPAAALREAQLALSRRPGWRSPFYWAAFQAHGEWN